MEPKVTISSLEKRLAASQQETEQLRRTLDSERQLQRYRNAFASQGTIFNNLKAGHLQNGLPEEEATIRANRGADYFFEHQVDIMDFIDND